MTRQSTDIPRLQAGWTLVELLVAMTLSLLLIAGIGQIYLAAKRSYDIQNRLARLEDVGRYAAEVISQDIRSAGYWGLSHIKDPAISITLPGGAPLPTPDNCTNGSVAWGETITRSIFGLDDTLNDGSNSYGCIAQSLGDVLAVRYANPINIASSNVPPLACGSSAYSSGLYVRTSRLSIRLAAGNPEFTCPSYPAGTEPAGPFTDHAVVAHAYYVRTPTSLRTTCGSTTYDVPELARVELDVNGQPTPPNVQGLVAGVEQLQFQYAVDLGGAPHQYQYMNANLVTGGSYWDKVVAVRFWILVRDICPDFSYDSNKYSMGNLIDYPPANDHFHRALYTSTVALRN